MPASAERGTPFFVSYAHAAEARPGEQEHNPDQHVQTFFYDLSRQVAELIPMRTGIDPGYLDRSVRGGVQWAKELLHALSTCEIMIALISARYITSKWCAMEWYAFQHRRIFRPNGSRSSQGCIIPVRWAPVEVDVLPSVISATTIFRPPNQRNPDIADLYWENGLFGLLEMEEASAYRVVVWRLAQEIKRVYDSQVLRPSAYRRKEQLHDVFAGWPS